MAPVIVCVVLTGMPPKMVMTNVVAAPVSAQKPSTGRRRNDPLPHGLDNAPAAEQRPQPHRQVTGQYNLGGHFARSVEGTSPVAGCYEQEEDYSHRLLRVVAAMAKTVQRGGQQLTPAEESIHLSRRGSAKSPS